MWDKWLPWSYDYSIYVNHPTNADLQGFDLLAAGQHYERFGEHEGRICSVIADRRAFIQLIPDHLSILEIGPFFSPAFVRPEKDVRYLDCFSSEQLASRAASLPEAAERPIPEIDYVWTGQRYADLVERRFSVVFSSHNIEHQHCLITHLRDIESILTEDGAVFLVVPDKRYCFDHFFPETTITDIVDAWMEQRTTHRAKDVLDHHLYTTHNDAGRHWQGDHGHNRCTSPLDGPRRACFLAEMEKLRTTAEHIDVHVWKFTPRAFKTAFDDLLNLNLTGLRVARVYPTVKNSNEFYVVLQKYGNQ